MATYFVTGATGFVGGEVTRQLLAKGHRVRALVRDAGRAAELQRAGAVLVKGDISDKESMRGPMEGVDGVFHIAGWYKVGTRDREQGKVINIDGTRNVLEAMRDAEVPKGVYTSTLGVFGNTGGKLVDETYRMNGPWLSEYDRTKWVAHYEVAEPMMKAGLPLVIVQPGVIYGLGDSSSLRRNLIAFLQGNLKRTPKGTGYCWGHIEDTARGHVLAMEKGRPGESYIIAGPPHTVIEAFDIAAKITGIPAPKSHPGPGTIRFIAALMGIADKIRPVSEDYNPETLRVIAGNTYMGSNAKAQRELGFTARPLEEGLAPVLRAEMAALGLKAP